MRPRDLSKCLLFIMLLIVSAPVSASVSVLCFLKQDCFISVLPLFSSMFVRNMCVSFLSFLKQECFRFAISEICMFHLFLSGICLFCEGVLLYVCLCIVYLCVFFFSYVLVL
jgi:hypothetical protein